MPRILDLLSGLCAVQYTVGVDINFMQVRKICEIADNIHLKFMLENKLCDFILWGTFNTHC